MAKNKEQLMAIKTYRPVTSTLRFQSTLVNDELTTDRPYKPLTESKQRTGGRRNQGDITSRFRGGGHKQKYRVIDFKREKAGISATVTSIEYDPNRSARIALLSYADGEKRYILQPDGLKLGAKKAYRTIDFKRDKYGIPAKVAAIEYDPNRSARIALLNYVDGEKRYILQPVGLEVGRRVMSGPEADILVGNSLPLTNIPAGTVVHAIELKPGKGAQMARSAGASAQLVSREGGYALLKLPSGEVRRVLDTCMATIGQVGNVDHENVSLGKAGRKRHMGKKPHNRGVVMNPVDHPHGGGEGKTSGGRHPVTPWGQPTRGYKTRNNKRTNQWIVTRRKKG